MASTGDYGTADPEYPGLFAQRAGRRWHQPQSERRRLVQQRNGLGQSVQLPRGRSSAPAAASACSKPEPALPAGRAVHRLAGRRRTSPSSPIRTPVRGLPTRTTWIASDPFEVVGGTSLSAPAWAGLVALVDQGRAAAGELTLNSSNSTDDAAGALQPAAGRLQRHQQRLQRLHGRRRLQPGFRAGDAGGQCFRSRT